MKKTILLLFLICTLGVQAQNDYWTSYTFEVEPQNVSTVYNLVDSYYKAHKAAGVSVRLFENHFKDHGNNYTHAIVFSGSLDAMGAMYGGGPNEGFDLFITRLNQHIKAGYSSSMGYGVGAYSGGEGPFPYRRMFMLKVNNANAFEAEFNKFNAQHNPNGRMIFLGGISSGRSAAGETHFVITAFKDFKTAMGGVMELIPADQREAWGKAWDASNQAGGGAEMISNSMRILMGEW